MWVPLTVVTFTTLSERQLPDASSIFHLIRNYGSSLFISLSVMVVVRTGNVSYSELSQTVNPFNEALQTPSVSRLWNFETASGLMSISREIARQAGMIGYINAFMLYTAACVAAMPFLLLVRGRRG